MLWSQVYNLSRYALRIWPRQSWVIWYNCAPSSGRLGCGQLLLGGLGTRQSMGLGHKSWLDFVTGFFRVDDIPFQADRPLKRAGDGRIICVLTQWRQEEGLCVHSDFRFYYHCTSSSTSSWLSLLTDLFDYLWKYHIRALVPGRRQGWARWQWTC